MLKIENNGNNGPNGSFVNMKKMLEKNKKINTGKAEEERKKEKKNKCIECIITPNSGHCFIKCDGHFCNNKVDAAVADMLACLHVEVKHQSNLIQKPKHSACTLLFNGII